MSRFLDICCPITGDLHAAISPFATIDVLRTYFGTSCLCGGRRGGLPCFSHCFLHCSSREVELGQGQLADVIHSGAVINNHTGNHCHWSEEMCTACVFLMWTVPVREVGLGRYSRMSHSYFFTRPRLNWSHRWHKICSSVLGQLCRRVSISYPGYKSWLAPSPTSPFDWIALQKPHSLSPTDWTVVTLKCFSPVGPFC